MRITSKVSLAVGAIVAAWSVNTYFTDRLGEESENQIMDTRDVLFPVAQTSQQITFRFSEVLKAFEEHLGAVRALVCYDHVEFSLRAVQCQRTQRPRRE